MLNYEFENDLAFLDGNNFKKVNKPSYVMTNAHKDTFYYY